MKIFCLFGVLLLPLVVLESGCGKKSAVAKAADEFGTNKLETVFGAGTPSQKNAIQKTEAGISQQNYTLAFDLLQGLTKDTTLSSDQSQALKDSMLALGKYPRSGP